MSKKYKTVILAGGFGTRLAEETDKIPKPMVEIGGKPILWHIMNIFSHYDFSEFILALGYKADFIKRYFLNYYAVNNHITLDLKGDCHVVDAGLQPDWKIHLVDTGLNTQTGGRLKRLKEWVCNETFFMTYGDGVADIDIEALLKFHRSHGKLATLTAVRPPARFGGIHLEGNKIVEFTEKNQSKEGWINGGFFVLEPEVLSFIHGDEIAWEREPLEYLAKKGELMAFFHEGFWQPMDTLRELRLLNSLWETGNAPWCKKKEDVLKSNNLR